MEKMNCDIIRDLIPSYVDGVCSESTKKCVEEHIENCGECRLLLASCKNQMLSGRNMEQKGLDGLKRIKGIIKIQNIVLYLVLAVMIFLGILLFIFHQPFVTYPAYSVLFAICVLVNVFAGITYKEKRRTGKIEYILGAVSLILNFYFALIYFSLAGRLRDGAETFLGIEMYRTGPFLETQLIICFIIQIVFFVYNVIGVMKYDKDNNWLLCINMMGIFLILKYEYWMGLMESFDTVIPMIARGTAEIALIGILGVIASLAGTKALNKKLKGNG